MASVQIYQYPLPGADGSSDEFRKDKIYISFLPIQISPAGTVINSLAEQGGAWKSPFITRENGKNKDQLDVTLDAAGSFSFSLPDDKVLIQLALPSSSIEDTFSSSWSDDDIDILKKLTDKGAGSQNITTSGISQVASGFQKSFGKVFPSIVLTSYEKTNRRSFSWNFHMIPQSKEEAIVCENIIHTFKRWSSPKGFSMEVLQQPYGVIPKITTYDGSECPLGRMLKLFPCVIEQVSVSYFDNGQVVTYKDGFPKSILLKLQTKEIIYHTRTSLGNEAIPMGS